MGCGIYKLTENKPVQQRGEQAGPRPARLQPFPSKGRPSLGKHGHLQSFFHPSDWILDPVRLRLLLARAGS